MEKEPMKTTKTRKLEDLWFFGILRTLPEKKGSRKLKRFIRRFRRWAQIERAATHATAPAGWCRKDAFVLLILNFLLYREDFRGIQV
ncbi:hypothetical protein ACFL2Q_08935, partial [Thermodesulfobacteriota bacterium]